jgi:hypothetical protein
VLHVVDGLEAYLVLAAVAVADGVLLYRFFASQRREATALAQSFSH